mmetsp:Transcript_29201/g.73317  ORF Transcript_29201/g.73317 Transcript_29201/m.73317 type:complete len:261 (+) Transcript_29201:342-1124(+)
MSQRCHLGSLRHRLCRQSRLPGRHPQRPLVTLVRRGRAVEAVRAVGLAVGGACSSRALDLAKARVPRERRPQPCDLAAAAIVVIIGSLRAGTTTRLRAARAPAASATAHLARVGAVEDNCSILRLRPRHAASLRRANHAARERATTRTAAAGAGTERGDERDACGLREERLHRLRPRARARLERQHLGEFGVVELVGEDCVRVAAALARARAEDKVGRSGEPRLLGALGAQRDERGAQPLAHANLRTGAGEVLPLGVPEL